MTRHLRLLSDAAKTVDARSTRSRQRKVGASEIGVCRRRAGYKHHGTKPSNPEHITGLPAVLGTWVHKGALDTMRREWGTLTEVAVENDLLRGHVDGIDLPNDWRIRAGLPPIDDAPDVVEVDDLKTKRDAWMVNIVRIRGPKRSELYQTHLYAGMLRRGEWSTHKRFAHLAALGPVPVETVRLRYFPRTGEENAEYVHEQPFDPDIEAEAQAWVQQVAQSASPDELPRDEDGPGLSVACDHCPFQTECWGAAGDVSPQSLLVVTDRDLVETLRDYDRARAEERDAKQRKDLARAKLDGSKPAIYVPTSTASEAWRLGWSGGNVGTPKLDVDETLARFEQMQELYRQAGLEPPEVAYHEAGVTARTIGVTPWDPPEPLCEKPVGPPAAWADDDGVLWLQDRPRGGWTGTTADTTEELTAGQFKKRVPDYVEPRPGCIHKKGHSGDCVPPSAIVEVDDEDESADLRAV